MITFKYKITQFDVLNKQLTVEFADGGWALIHLVNPLPENIEQLDEIVRRYAMPVEVLEARNTDADLSFITDLVGKQREAARIDNRPKSVSLADELFAETVADEEEQRVVLLIESVLREKGLISA